MSFDEIDWIEVVEKKAIHFDRFELLQGKRRIDFFVDITQDLLSFNTLISVSGTVFTDEEENRKNFYKILRVVSKEELLRYEIKNVLAFETKKAFYEVLEAIKKDYLFEKTLSSYLETTL